MANEKKNESIAELTTQNTQIGISGDVAKFVAANVRETILESDKNNDQILQRNEAKKIDVNGQLLAVPEEGLTAEKLIDFMSGIYMQGQAASADPEMARFTDIPIIIPINKLQLLIENPRIDEKTRSDAIEAQKRFIKYDQDGDKKLQLPEAAKMFYDMEYVKPTQITTPKKDEPALPPK